MNVIPSRNKLENTSDFRQCVYYSVYMPICCFMMNILFFNFFFLFFMNIIDMYNKNEKNIEFCVCIQLSWNSSRRSKTKAILKVKVNFVFIVKRRKVCSRTAVYSSISFSRCLYIINHVHERA